MFSTADVWPDIELGPVGEREDAEAVARVLARVVKAPEFRALCLRIPAMGVERKRTCAPWRGFFLRRGARRRTRRRSRSVSSACLRPWVFHHVGVMAEPCVKGLTPAPLRPRVGVHMSFGRRSAARRVAQRNTFPGTSTCIDVQQGKRGRCREESLSGQVQQDRTNPFQPSTSSPALDTPRRLRGGCGCSRLRGVAERRAQGARSGWRACDGRDAGGACTGREPTARAATAS